MAFYDDFFDSVGDAFSPIVDPVTNFVNEEILGDVFGVDDLGLAGSLSGSLLGLGLGGHLNQGTGPLPLQGIPTSVLGGQIIGGAGLLGIDAPLNMGEFNTGSLLGRSSAERLQSIRDKLESDNRAEALRKQFNDDIFALAQNLSGGLAFADMGGNLSLAATPGGEAQSSININELIPINDEGFNKMLQFSGDDPREKQLQKMTLSLANRARDIQSQRTTPGLQRQTRLSLVG